MLMRDFNTTADTDQIRECVIELQNFERRIDSRMPSGEDIADAYIAELLSRCVENSGKILIAEFDGHLAGYVTILTKVRSGDLDDGDIEFGLVADIVVRRKYRGNGIGRKLIAAAESFARSQNVRWLRVSVLAENEAARKLYEKAGFAELYVDLEKDLGTVESDT
jgi:GNAT superfamily N-acetyltransferase